MRGVAIRLQLVKTRPYSAPLERLDIGQRMPCRLDRGERFARATGDGTGDATGDATGDVTGTRRGTRRGRGIERQARRTMSGLFPRPLPRRVRRGLWRTGPLC